MTKQPVNAKWFEQLRTGGLKERLEWLIPLSTCVDRLVSFGCWSSEPFALIWTLDAAEATVVELRKENLGKPKDELERLRLSNLVATSPLYGCMDGRSIELIVGDVTKIDELPSNHFDLAYCEDVLYEIELESAGLVRVQSAADEMTRVVKPGRWVIACEDKMRDPYPGGDLIDISQCFLAAGLEKVSCTGAPESCNCYSKPDGLSNPSLETTVQ